MDILRPSLVWVGDRCYRKLTGTGEGRNPEEEDFDDRDFISDTTYSDEPCDADLNIVETEKGLRLKLEVPNAYYKHIIGKKGETKMRIEKETHTRIIVPKQGDKSEQIVILGHSRPGIVSAKTRIDILLDSARQKQQFTHFLSIPVNTEKICNAFEDFKFEVLRECDGDQGLDVSLFQTKQKLHLTIGTMPLLSASEIGEATKLLEALKEDVIEPILRGEKLEVRVQGLEYMNDDPRAVDVLYAKIQEGDAFDRLQMLVDRIVDKFSSAGLMKQEHEHVKLHVTVMNTLMRKDPSGASVPRTARGEKPRESFNASNIMKKFSQFDFGSLDVNTIHLSERLFSPRDSYYNPASIITFLS